MGSWLMLVSGTPINHQSRWADKSISSSAMPNLAVIANTTLLPLMLPCRSIEFRLRLPGVDLWTSHKPAWSEVMLQFMLLGAVYLHKYALSMCFPCLTAGRRRRSIGVLSSNLNMMVSCTSTICFRHA